MADLDTAIRARLDEFTSDHLLIGEYGSDPRPGHTEMKSALLAVLDLHKLETEHSWELYRPSWAPERKPSGPLCSQCSAGQEHQVASPCPTVRAVAKALGVEADG